MAFVEKKAAVERGWRIDAGGICYFTGKVKDVQTAPSKATAAARRGAQRL